MNTPLISFIVPIYKVEKYLKKCIESLIGQSYANIEIILIEDGSPDSSGEICDYYAEKDSRVKVIHQNNLGVSIARNKGLEMATGEWICFVDGDDWVENKLVEIALNHISNDIDICFFSYYDVCKDKKLGKANQVGKLNYAKEDFVNMQKAIFEMRGFQYTNAAAIWAKLFRREFLERNSLRFKENQVKSQDTLFMLYVYECARTGIYINEQLYNYRIVRESISRKYNPLIIEIYTKLLQEFKCFVQEYKNNEKFDELYQYRVFRNFMVAVTLDFCHIENKKKYSVRKREFLNSKKIEPFCTAIKNVKSAKYPFKERILAVLIKHEYFLTIDIINKLRYICRKMG